MIGRLETVPALDRLDLLADPVAAALEAVPGALVAPIDPAVADTAALVEAYEVPLQMSANCVVVAGRRGGEQRWAACVVLATTRVDVNGVVRKRLDVRKVSFAAMGDAVAATEMEYGGITPVGVPCGWPVFVDPAVAATALVVVGSGVRRSKLVLPGAALLDLPGAELVDGLGR